MQLNKLSPLAVAILAALLSACGGGGDDAPPPPPPAAPAPAPVIKVSAVTLHSSTPKTIEETPIQFDGGVCSGGTGTLTQTWDFDDTPAAGAINTPNPNHTYRTNGAKTVKVTCTDSVGTTLKEAKLTITVQPAAMNGFLGKTWTAYSKLDASNNSPYPVAGLASSGDVYGVWLRKNASNVTEAVAGTTSFSSTSWSTPTLLATGTAASPYNVTLPGQSTAAIDVAVAPNGRAMAAWLAGSSIWYASKDVTGAWSTPTELTGETVKTDASASIKVVVNDTGDAAIAYCESDTKANVIPIFDGARKDTTEISKHCGVEDKSLMFGFQRHRAFDIAIDNKSPSTVYAVGVGSVPPTPGTTTSDKFVVYAKNYTKGGNWTPKNDLSAEIVMTPAVIDPVTKKQTKAASIGFDSFKSLSLSLAPNGEYAAAAWEQFEEVNGTSISHVYTSFRKNDTWGAAIAVKGQVPTNHYRRPKVAMNDKGQAFLAMEFTVPPATIYTTIVHNCDASVATPEWSNSEKAFDTYGFNATDIAIDKWGTGLITVYYADKSQARTFSMAGVLSGYSIISPSYPRGTVDPTFRYQTMRALPDGRAVLVTSVYDSVTHSGTPISSGYSLLK